MQFSTATDREIMAEIGERLRALRERRNLTQVEAATRADIGRHTLYRAEKGDNLTLDTLLRLLRVYGRIEAIDNFIPRPQVSPMARLRRRKENEG